MSAKAFAERRQIGNLAADMHMHADGRDARQAASQIVEARCVLPGHAELIARPPGRYLVMGLGVHIRIDAEGDPGRGAARGRNLGHGAQLVLGLHVERVDAFIQRVGDLLARLADTGKHDALRRNARCPGAPQLAFRNHIHAGAQGTEGAQHRQIGIGFDGEADQRVAALEGIGEHTVVALQRGGRIAIKWRAHRRRECGKADIFGVQDAGPVGKMMHSRSHHGRSTTFADSGCAGEASSAD